MTEPALKFGRHVQLDTTPRTQPTLTRLLHTLGWMPAVDAAPELLGPPSCAPRQTPAQPSPQPPG